MEFPEFKTLSEMAEMEDSCFNIQWPVNSTDDHFSLMSEIEENNHQFHAHAPALFEYHQPVMEPSLRDTKQLKPSDHSLMNRNLVHVKPEDGAFVFSEGVNGLCCSNSPSSNSANLNNYAFSKDFQGANTTSIRNMSRRVTPNQDHILAERKRREKLSHCFISLSALLPNLKKMDKASVLGDAIEYMKTLKEKVKTLEEQTSNVESKKVEMVARGGGIGIASSDDNISSFSEQLPEIEARFIGKDVLIRIHCEKKSGVVENTLAEIEKQQLCVINSSAVIFANSMLHITVIAQMDKDLTMTIKDFVKNLHFGLKQFM